MPQPLLPQRETLPHAQPTWVDREAVYFLTVCAEPRRVNQLCHGHVAGRIRESLEFRIERADWTVHACVLMPDHLHVLARVSTDVVIQRLVSAWKRHLARSCGICWQRDFFEHRLRRDEHFDSKLEYLRQNPVRAGLVEIADDWPYFWTW